MGATSELKSCPFCGGEARIRSIYCDDDPTHCKEPIPMTVEEILEACG